MQKKVVRERQDKISIETPYGTIESDSGNHFVDIATVLLIIVACAALKIAAVKMFRTWIFCIG